jgi:LysM repeat protein
MQPHSLPGRTSRGGNRIAGCALAILLVCITLAIAVGLSVIVESPPPTLPLVAITEPRPGNQVAQMDTVVIAARAQDPDRIKKVEFWVNGQLIGAQASTNPQGESPFLASQVWRPSALGMYTVFARAFDTQGHSAQSSVVLVQAVEKSAPDPNAVAQVIAQPGDTVASIAQDNGTTPEEVRRHNPDLGAREPAPGDSVLVPAAPETERPSDDAPPGGGPSDVPIVGPPSEPPPPPPGGGGGTSAPYIPPFSLGDLHDGLRDLCVRLPRLPGCSDAPVPDATAPTAPHSISATRSDCRVEIRWTDDTTDELGYRVYRQPARGAFQLIAIVGPGSTRAVDASPPPGTQRYFIAAFNTSPTPGISGVTAPVEVPRECLRLTLVDATLEIEALRMDVRGTFDGISCYFALAGGPYERVPNSGMMRLREGHWNITDYLGGENKRRVVVSRSVGLEVTANCLGRRGRELSALGEFTRVHPEAEWDGREIVVDAGGFAIAYRIQPASRSGSYAIHWGTPALDSSIPPPYNLRVLPDGWVECPDEATDPGSCTRRTGEMGLLWDWRPAEGSIRRAVGYRVFRRSSSELPPGGFGRMPDLPVAYHETNAPSHSAPLSSPDCPAGNAGGTSRLSYTATAVVQNPDGQFSESPQSNPIEVIEPCPVIVRVTLNRLETGTLDDGCGGFLCTSTDTTVEAYGYLGVNSRVIYWNQSHMECTSGYIGTPPPGCGFAGTITPAGREPPFLSVSPPHHTLIRSSSPYNWNDMTLKITDARGMDFRLGAWGPDLGYRRGNAVVEIPFTHRSEIRFSFGLWDYDDVGGNDQWCQGSTIFDARSPAEWAAFSEVRRVEGRGVDGSCVITISVSGSGR